MLQPKKVKHRKMMKGRNRGKAHRGNKVSFGDYGLQALSAGFVSARQIESARIAMTRHGIGGKPAVFELPIGFQFNRTSATGHLLQLR